MFSINASAAELIDKIIAKVDGEIITLYDLETMRSTLPAYKEMNAAYKNFETDEERNLFLLDMLINDQLILKEIEKSELSATDNDINMAIGDIASQNGMTRDEFMKNVKSQGLKEQAYREMLKRQIEKMRFYGRFINSKVHVTQKEVLTFFREKKEFFKRNQVVVFHHILFPKKEDNKIDAKRLADEFLKTLKETGSFNDAVAPLLNSDDVKVTSDISMKKMDLAPDFKAPLMSISPGEASEIIENGNGYNVIVLKQMEAISLGTFKERIQKTIINQKRDKVYKSMLSKLRQEHSIEKRY